MASFVRQLNMYGFHKKVGVDSGGLKSEHVEEQEFYHTFFLRGQEHLLENIKRKVASSKGGGGAGPMGGGTNFAPATYNSDKINGVLNEVTQLKDKQEDMDGKLDTMKKENEALWREVVTLRQKHLSQQKIVNKLIQFLVSLVSQPRMPSGLTTGSGVGASLKRRFNQQLAIEGTTPTKEPKIQQASDIHHQHTSAPTFIPTIAVGSSRGGGQGAGGSLGPTIREVFANEGDDDGSYYPSVTQPISVVTPMSPFSEAVAAAIDPHTADSSFLAYANNGQSSANSQTMASPGKTTRPVLHRELSREDMDIEVSTVQKDLDHLKDMLSGQITLDSSLISNLFNPEESLSNLLAGGLDFGLPVGATSPGVLPGNLPPLEMEMPSTGASAAGSKGELSGIISPGPSYQPSVQGATNQQHILPSDELEDQPTLLELADMEDIDVVGDDGVSISTSSKGEKVKNDRGHIKMNLIPNEDLSLNTPLVSASDDMPFFRSMGAKKK